MSMGFIAMFHGFTVWHEMDETSDSNLESGFRIDCFAQETEGNPWRKEIYTNFTPR